jgi:hypothetical protein
MIVSYTCSSLNTAHEGSPEFPLSRTLPSEIRGSRFNPVVPHTTPATLYQGESLVAINNKTALGNTGPVLIFWNPSLFVSMAPEPVP